MFNALPVALAAFLPISGPVPAAAPPGMQDTRCVTDQQRDGTIYIHNGCGQQVYWMACVRAQSSEVTHSYEASAIASGADFELSPANDPAPFAYHILYAFQPTDFRC